MRKGTTFSPYEDKNYLWMSCRILPEKQESVVVYATTGYRNAVIRCLAVAHRLKPIQKQKCPLERSRYSQRIIQNPTALSQLTKGESK